MSHMMQMSVTTVFGIIGLIFFICTYNPEISYYKLGRVIIILVIALSFTMFGTKQNTFTVKGFSLKKIIGFIKGISRTTHLKNAFYSVIRYFVFSFQFFVLLKIFGVDVFYFNAMVVITTMYLLASIIPSVFIFDVIVKGSVALYIFDMVGVNDLTVLSIMTLMWIMNFVIPSIAGSFFVLRFNASNLMRSAKKLNSE
jgi:hypothetical protein